MKLIDSHTHVGKFGQWSCSVASLLAAMGGFGVSQALVSTLSANEFDYAVQRIPTELDQLAINDELLQDVKASAGRLKALFWIRPFSETVDARLKQYLTLNRDWFVGLKVHPLCAGLPFTVENYRAYLDLCRELALPFCIHSQPDGYANIKLIAAAARQYPQVNFVAVHMELGTNHRAAMQMIRDCSNLYGDTTLVEPADVAAAMETCGSEKILFGSDAVVFGENSYARYAPLKELISGEAAEKLFCGNAQKLFGLK